MTGSGNIDDYFNLFDGYQLDQEDQKVLRQIFATRNLCAKCYRPYKKFSDGSSNRYQRWQVTIEILSFYVFILTAWWWLVIVITVPALLVGLWGRIQSVADSSKQLAAKGAGDAAIAVRKSSEGSYRSQIRQIIEEELTSEEELMQQKLDKIIANFPQHKKGKKKDKETDNREDTENEEREHRDNRKSTAHSQGTGTSIGNGNGISNDQYIHLVSMMNALAEKVDSLSRDLQSRAKSPGSPDKERDLSMSRSSSVRQLKKRKSNRSPRNTQKTQRKDGGGSYTPSPRRATTSTKRTSRK